MLLDSPLQISRWFLAAFGTRMFVHHEDRLPTGGAVLVVSNHRSFMDPPVLMAAVGRPIRFACHHYMGQVPVLREFVTGLGCFPLDEAKHRQHGFLQQGMQLLQARQMVGVFPEGADPMVRVTEPGVVGEFQRGFAHLALRAQVRDLAVLPVAIASFEEVIYSGLPVKVLSLFDPSEPHFKQEGYHPVVVYRRINVLIGEPYWITPVRRQSYQGKHAKSAVSDLTDHCQAQIAALLRLGC